jgi:hypothetical protein
MKKLMFELGRFPEVFKSPVFGLPVCASQLVIESTWKVGGLNLKEDLSVRQDLLKLNYQLMDSGKCFC